MLEAERERGAQAAKTWYDGVTPKRATLPSWIYDSVGDRFFSDDDIAAAAAAPPLAEAILPPKEELSQDPRTGPSPFRPWCEGSSWTGSM
jgi:hypothetical protein